MKCNVAFVQLLLTSKSIGFSNSTKMNDGRHMGVPYVDTAGFPYAVNESFTDFFQGPPNVPVNYAFPGSMPDQVCVSTLKSQLAGC